MAIVRTEPHSSEENGTVIVYSNANSNSKAIKEIEAYCAQNNLIRAKENNLAFGDDKELGKLYRCVCGPG